MLGFYSIFLKWKGTYEISVKDFVVEDTVAAISGSIALLAFSQLLF